jgi:hypothetical protein
MCFDQAIQCFRELGLFHYDLRSVSLAAILCHDVEYELRSLLHRHIGQFDQRVAGGAIGAHDRLVGCDGASKVCLRSMPFEQKRADKNVDRVAAQPHRLQWRVRPLPSQP